MSRLPARSHYGKHVFNTTGHKPVFDTTAHGRVFDTTAHGRVFDTTLTGASSTRRSQARLRHERINNAGDVYSQSGEKHGCLR